MNLNKENIVSAVLLYVENNGHLDYEDAAETAETIEQMKNDLSAGQVQPYIEFFENEMIENPDGIAHQDAAEILRFLRSMERKRRYFNGKYMNLDHLRPVMGLPARVCSAGKVSDTVYELVNILMNGGRHDTYVLKNPKTGKLRRACEIYVYQ